MFILAGKSTYVSNMRVFFSWNACAHTSVFQYFWICRSSTTFQGRCEALHSRLQPTDDRLASLFRPLRGQKALSDTAVCMWKNCSITAEEQGKLFVSNPADLCFHWNQWLFYHLMPAWQLSRGKRAFERPTTKIKTDHLKWEEKKKRMDNMNVKRLRLKRWTSFKIN